MTESTRTRIARHVIEDGRDDITAMLRDLADINDTVNPGARMMLAEARTAADVAIARLNAALRVL